MQVDGDAAYVGQYGYDYYDHSSYYRQFASDLGMLTNFSLEHVKTICRLDFPRHSKELEFEKPKKLFRQHTEISLAIHEAMKYKPALTSNKFEILETKSEMHNKFDQNANFSGPKQSTAATKTEANMFQFQKVKNGNLDSKVNLAKTTKMKQHAQGLRYDFDLRSFSIKIVSTCL